MTRPAYLERLGARVAETRTCLCLGIDPDPGALPPGFPSGLAGVERLAHLLVDAAAPYAAAVKVNVAFFEAFGSAGIAALERLRTSLPASLPFIADAKRGDIGSTSARIADALYDALPVPDGVRFIEGDEVHDVVAGDFLWEEAGQQHRWEHLDGGTFVTTSALPKGSGPIDPSKATDIPPR